MPFCHVTLAAPKPPPEGYPEEPETVGEHLRKVRMDRGMLQREVAEVIGVSEGTVYNWEHGRSRPALRNWPAVIAFLGFVPLEVGDPLAERIRAWRKVHGVPRRELARRIGVDVSTVWRWEAGTALPEVTTRERLEALLDSLPTSHAD